MKLEELKNKEIKFDLVKTGTHILRDFTLADEIYCKNEYGKELATLFNKDTFDMDIISQIVFNLLKDKSEYKVQEITTYDKNGEELVERVGGYKLFQQSILGMKEKLIVLNACVQAINLAANIEEQEVEVSGDKKKVE